MRKFECCRLEFPTEEALVQHRVDEHFEHRKIVGSCCGVDFFTNEGLKAHQQTTHGRRGERS